MSGTSNFLLPFDDAAETDVRLDARDRAGRERAVDPRFNVALEASAGTGKTRVLVDRYINLLRAGVDPSNILAITFTRKAAAEMRERIVATLRVVAAEGGIAASRWRELRDRTADIAISTIDAFCLSLLREFPLEADLDPAFSLADETEVPRLIDESLDRALRLCRALAREDENVALVFAQIGERRARRGLAVLLNRRLVAPAVLAKYLATGPRELTVDVVARRAASALLEVFASLPGGLDAFVESAPPQPTALLLSRDLRRLAAALDGSRPFEPAAVQGAFTRVRDHFLTQEGEPRKKLPYSKQEFTTEAAWRTHRDLVVDHGGDVLRVSDAYRRDLNVLVAHGTWRMYRIAETEYHRTLDAHAVLDFSDVLLRALQLLRQMEEFAQSRYRLESRYHHVLVDEFQDTSRAQWELVSLLIKSWGEGTGLAHSGPIPPSIFLVGDRKQSIYGFRDADVSLLREAAAHLEALRPDGDVRRSISRSFRSVPRLLSFVNDLAHDVAKAAERADAFRYDEQDRFPIDESPQFDRDDALGIVVGDSPEACAELTATEIARLLATAATVRDRDMGLPRPIRPGDVAILFRTRESHREYEAALEARAIPSYVYKGLGFFDADEIKDVLALLWYLADPLSDLRAAALMRSRFIRLSDAALRQLAPRLADVLRLPKRPEAAAALEAVDAQVLDRARAATARWRGLVDRVPPAELLDTILGESAYAVEMRGPRFQQARENIKKMRSLVRRIQNRGYSTLGRIAAHLDRLAVGDESNAAIDALDAVNLMTVHASKGLEFPVVFLVNLSRGTGNRRDPIRVAVDPRDASVSVSVGDFQSDADDDGGAREREETKRLMYVALTRARDRLYLGSALKEGRVQPGRGSLGEVLPPPLLEQFAVAMASPASVEWVASSGTRHVLRVCSAQSAITVGERPEAEAIDGDFAPLPNAGTPRVTAGALVADAVAPRRRAGGDSDLLIGTVVHRLLQRNGLAAIDAVPLRVAARAALRDEELTLVEELDPFVTAAADAYLAICGQPEVRMLYGAGERLHEVPFTLQHDGVFVRGSIDCLVRSTDGTGSRLTILEFKTGRPRPEHQAQVDLYTRAVQAMFPGAPVDARLIYAQSSSLSSSR
jgi:ATP-dependent helicase/nuclease subunit A